MEHDATSDYGSDFTPDEEEILSSLLQRAPAAHFEDTGLLIKDIEDNESSRGARVPRTYPWRQHLSASKKIPFQNQSSHLAVETSIDSNTLADGERTERSYKNCD